MRADVIFFALAAGRKQIVSLCDRSCNKRLLCRIFATVCCAVTLAGCSISPVRNATAAATPTNVSKRMEMRTRVPLPDSAQLTPPKKPDCEFRESNPDVGRKLAYERECYRQSEIILRIRLQDLQRSVKRTINAVKTNSQYGS